MDRARIETDVDGLSGLTMDGEGHAIAVAERGTALVAIEDRAVRIPLEGVPAGIDTESIAWLGEDRFALGTESMDESRHADLVLVVERANGRARVVDRIELPYSLLGITAEENRGIEGLCFVADGGVLLAAMENVVERGGQRFAPLGIRRGDRWTGRALVRLTSETGKLSALDCRRDGDAIDVLAIERHYGVMRVLRFALREGDTCEGDIELTPRVIYDLAGQLDGDPNLEGLVRDGDELVLIVDNHHGRRTGPNEVLRLPLP
ncbi:MAG: esterase-like activity of phytase family protein [Sandaracinaceae bacterium]